MRRAEEMEGGSFVVRLAVIHIYFLFCARAHVRQWGKRGLVGVESFPWNLALMLN